MLKNYLKTALRNLWRKKGSTLINIAGLSLGIAGSLVLFLIVSRHSTFDRYHSKADRIYRISHSAKGNDGDRFTPGIPNVLPDALRNDFPDLEEVVFTSYRSGALILIPQGNGESPKNMKKRKASCSHSLRFSKRSTVRFSWEMPSRRLTIPMKR